MVLRKLQISLLSLSRRDECGEFAASAVSFKQGRSRAGLISDSVRTARLNSRLLQNDVYASVREARVTGQANDGRKFCSSRGSASSQSTCRLSGCLALRVVAKFGSDCRVASGRSICEVVTASRRTKPQRNQSVRRPVCRQRPDARSRQPRQRVMRLGVLSMK
jgi:hypothetical protein